MCQAAWRGVFLRRSERVRSRPWLIAASLPAKAVSASPLVDECQLRWRFESAPPSTAQTSPTARPSRRQAVVARFFPASAEAAIHARRIYGPHRTALRVVGPRAANRVFAAGHSRRKPAAVSCRSRLPRPRPRCPSSTAPCSTVVRCASTRPRSGRTVSCESKAFSQHPCDRLAQPMTPLDEQGPAK